MTNYSPSFRKKLGLVSLVILATQLPCSIANAMDVPMEFKEEQTSKKRERSLNAVEIEEEHNRDTKRQKLSSDDPQTQEEQDRVIKPLMEEDLDATHAQALLLKSQLEEVSKFVEYRKSQGLPIRMVFGATTKESERIEGSEGIKDGSVIYLDISSHDPQSKPHIQASFNDLDQLSQIAITVGPNLDQIVVDDSTFKAAQWTKKHLDKFAAMLKKDGEFMFPTFVREPEAAGEHIISNVKEIDGILKKTQVFLVDGITGKFYLPKFTPHLDLETPEVIEDYNKYFPYEKFNNLTMDQYWDKLDELKVKEYIYPWPLGFEIESGILKHKKIPTDIEIKQSIALPLQSTEYNKGICEKIYNEYYHPHIKMVLAQHFEQVELKENTTLPFPSNGNDKIAYLMVAKNPK